MRHTRSWRILIMAGVFIVVPFAATAQQAGTPKPQSEFETLYQQGLALERGGKAAEAVRLYRRAARGGSGKAATRLGDIFDRGAPGVPRNYVEAMQWYKIARELGEPVMEGGWGCPPRCSK